MKKNKKDKVYSESFLGEPSINTKELEKENESFLNSKDSREQTKILYKKVCRIEKTVYFIILEIFAGIVLLSILCA